MCHLEFVPENNETEIDQSPFPKRNSAIPVCDRQPLDSTGIPLKVVPADDAGIYYEGVFSYALIS